MQNNEPGWYPPPGEDTSTTPYTLTKMGLCPEAVPPQSAYTWYPCNETFCLFNVSADPCEHHEISARHPDIVDAMVKRLKDYQATAVPPVQGAGCKPVINKRGAWRPCDSPEVLAGDYDVARTRAFHDARAGESGYQLSGTGPTGQRFARDEEEA